MEADAAYEAFTIVGSPPYVFIEQHGSVYQDAGATVGFAAGIAFNIHLHMVPFCLFKGARGGVGSIKVIAELAGLVFIIQVGLENGPAC